MLWSGARQVLGADQLDQLIEELEPSDLGVETGAAAPDASLQDSQGLDSSPLLGRVDLVREDPGGQKGSFGQPRDGVREQLDCVHVLQFVGGIRGLEKQGLQAGNVLCLININI